MTLLVVFIFFLFSTLGLGLICASDIHAKFSRHRRDISLLAVAAENGVKQGFDLLSDVVAFEAGVKACTESRFEELRLDFQAGGIAAFEDASGLSFPLSLEGRGENQIWVASADFSLDAASVAEGYFIADYKGEIRAEGRLAGVAPVKRAGLDVMVSVMAGRVPLPYFPLLIAGDLDPQEKRAIEENPSVLLLPPRRRTTFPRLNFGPASSIPKDADPLLKKALKVKMFSPDKLTRAEIRSALGLEMVNAPVPDGVYLIENDTGLGGVFVQGDVDEIVLAIDSGYQAISFRRGEDVWLLEFCPAKSETMFTTPAGTRTFNRSPLGMILVNGRVASLGGGIVNPAGQPELNPGDARPCVLDGVGLTIVCADEVALSSHLVAEGVEWHDGIPYLKKDAGSQLMLYANGRDFVENTPKAGKITIRADAPADLKVQAALTAAGTFEIGGSRKTILLTGGLQTAGLATNGNTLKILPDERLLGAGIIPQNSPAAAAPLLAILALRPLRWNED